MMLLTMSNKQGQYYAPHYVTMSPLCRAGIESVFNLQQPGEHKNCGPGLEESSGFTYLPEHLMSQGGVCIGCDYYFRLCLAAMTM